MADINITRNCLNCNKPLKESQPLSAKYCCRECLYTAMGGRVKMPIEMRFFRHVNKTETCWEWTGKINRGGYGVIWSMKKSGSAGEERAHRVSWRIHYGEITGGLFVLHRCDNRKCVRPDHLFLGTFQDNMDDMKMKRRSTIGTRNPRAKFTEDDVRAIRKFPAHISNVEIAAQFSMSRRNVADIRAHKIWKYVE